MRDLKQELYDALSVTDSDKDTYADGCSNDPDHINGRIESLTPTGSENIAALQQAYMFVLLENDKFDMKNWVHKNGGFNSYDYENNEYKPLITKKQGVSCGTTMCLAGSVAFFNLAENEGMNAIGNIYTIKNINGREFLDHFVNTAEDRGRQIMGLSYTQAQTLFRLPTDVRVVKAALNFIAQRDLTPVDLTPTV